jgi:hypothetical protein
MEEITIDSYKAQFEQFPADLLEFCLAEEITLPSINSLKGQAIALLAQPENRGKRFLSRPGAKVFFESVGLETHDAIQPFNKAMGLKKIKARGKYCLVYPFEADKVDIIKRKGCKISGDKDEKINAVKDFWRTILVDVPNEQWQEGHLDPTTPDSSEANLAWQPPIQARYRDRFKWDQYFMKMWPTGKEAAKNLDKFWTKEEQQNLLNALKKSLGEE